MTIQNLFDFFLFLIAIGLFYAGALLYFGAITYSMYWLTTFSSQKKRTTQRMIEEHLLVLSNTILKEMLGRCGSPEVLNIVERAERAQWNKPFWLTVEKATKKFAIEAVTRVRDSNVPTATDAWFVYTLVRERGADDVRRLVTEIERGEGVPLDNEIELV